MGKTPVGVVLLGFLALVAGVAHLFSGLTLMGYVAFWEGELGSGMFLWGAITFALGVAFMACAIALWTTATWAWLFTNFVAVIGLVDAVFVLLASHDVAEGFAVALLPIVVLWYLHQPATRAAFRVDEIAD
jgi:hypothetical protein